MKRYDLATLNLNRFFSVSEHTNVRHEVCYNAYLRWFPKCEAQFSSFFEKFKYKTLAEKIRDFLPQPSISASQTVQVEHTNEAMREDNNDNDGAGEAMAQVDDDDGDLV